MLITGMAGNISHISGENIFDNILKVKGPIFGNMYNMAILHIYFTTF